MSFLHAKDIYPVPTSPFLPTYLSSLASTLSKTSSEYHLNQVLVILGIIHSGSKYLFFCKPVKLDNKLSASKIQWLEKCVKHPHSKSERLKGRKRSWVPSKSKTLAEKIPVDFKA